MQDDVGLGGLQRPQVDQRRAATGDRVRQLSGLASSPASSGSTAIAGSDVSRSSPQVWSMSTGMEKNHSEIDAVPLICHGVGPVRVTSRETLNSPTPNTLTRHAGGDLRRRT